MSGSFFPRRPRAVGAQHGQATVELVAMLPLLAVVAMAAFCVLAAGRARELAAHGAQAGAMAMLQEADPAEAARSALPGVRARDLSVEVRDRVVRVTVRPRLPLRVLAEPLTAVEHADAGPEPAR